VHFQKDRTGGGKDGVRERIGQRQKEEEEGRKWMWTGLRKLLYPGHTPSALTLQQGGLGRRVKSAVGCQLGNVAVLWPDTKTHENTANDICPLSVSVLGREDNTHQHGGTCIGRRDCVRAQFGVQSED
jgi:hypothetical protein